ncbi:MAG: hypothetical protein E3J67_01380 [Dehalococcoidia bacterium]|nr:MAG: hypothetical protein E3J67_01380 [Dehalococcoidia bacterium]
MKARELQLILALVVLIILTFVMSFTVLKDTATFGGGFLFFLLVPVATIIYIAIYMTKSWKEHLK